MKKITYDIEWQLENSHWWFIGKRKLLKNILRWYNVTQGTLTLDIGCGVGSNLGLLRSIGLKAIGVDSEMYSLALVKKHFSELPLVNGNLLNLPFKNNSVHFLVATDILEHLQNDVAGIQEIFRVLRKGGLAVFTVPAFMFLWGTQDIVGMHYRRYTQRGFIRKIKQQGFQISRTSYFNFILFLPILFIRRFISVFGLTIESENKLNSPLINDLLKFIFSLEMDILKIFSFPIGVSILCIAKKR